ncbi:FAD-binding oxidoreductase [Corynebacterium sp. YIM 101645]|uniref:FAD-binding oxidoreductase n=1 Tax=Corynebacterium lemuris TaxID=1859292 RepID=A0ABT2FXV1_9CORY|nr:FAD-binding oxidoreductase [Corynebacterium lemuris]MCS5480055.1 FAD-binding oxidoreductase [Corynebacterium lemuris]
MTVTTQIIEDVRTRATQARAEFEAVVGAENIHDEKPALQEFTDPYDNRQRPRFTASYVIQPGSTEEIQQIVQIASRHRVPLWTGSQGRNNGYGGSAGRVDGSVVLNLRRMNRVLEVNEKFGYVVVEPDVSFAELNAYLVDNGYNLWTDVPDLSWGSVMGNTLEHGVGYTPYGEHADFVCGMEVVLADGDLVRTGMGAQSNSRISHNHQRGFGPRLDEMFMQSNFGIVTRMGLWAMPRPEAWRAVWIHCDTDDACYELIDALRPLLMDGTIRNRVTIMSLMAVVPTQTVKADWQPDHAPVTEEVRALMRERTGLGNWNARIGLYGAPALMEIQEQQIQDAITHIDGARLVSREYRGDVKAEEVLPQDQAMAGIPNMDLLNFLNWYGWEHTGHVSYGPIMPLTGEDGKQMHELLVRHCDRIGRDFGEAFALTPRSMQMFALVLYDAANQEDLERTYVMTADLIRESAAMGYGEYRGHLEFMDLIGDQFDFNDNASRRLNEKIKNALDPAGILSPGRQGIWGGEFSRPANNPAYFA